MRMFYAILSAIALLMAGGLYLRGHSGQYTRYRDSDVGAFVAVAFIFAKLAIRWPKPPRFGIPTHVAKLPSVLAYTFPSFYSLFLLMVLRMRSVRAFYASRGVISAEQVASA